MFKNLIILLLSVFLLFSCSGKNKEVKVAEPTEEEKILAIYTEAVEALKKGDVRKAKALHKAIGRLLK